MDASNGENRDYQTFWDDCYAREPKAYDEYDVDLPVMYRDLSLLRKALAGYVKAGCSELETKHIMALDNTFKCIQHDKATATVHLPTFAFRIPGFIIDTGEDTDVSDLLIQCDNIIEQAKAFGTQLLKMRTDSRKQLKGKGDAENKVSKPPKKKQGSKRQGG